MTAWSAHGGRRLTRTNRAQAYYRVISNWDPVMRISLARRLTRTNWAWPRPVRPVAGLGTAAPTGREKIQKHMGAAWCSYIYMKTTISRRKTLSTTNNTRKTIRRKTTQQSRNSVQMIDGKQYSQYSRVYIKKIFWMHVLAIFCRTFLFLGSGRHW
jgi:hypothetical protein